MLSKVGNFEASLLNLVKIWDDILIKILGVYGCRFWRRHACSTNATQGCQTITAAYLWVSGMLVCVIGSIWSIPGCAIRLLCPWLSLYLLIISHFLTTSTGLAMVSLPFRFASTSFTSARTSTTFTPTLILVFWITASIRSIRKTHLRLHIGLEIIDLRLWIASLPCVGRITHWFWRPWWEIVLLGGYLLQLLYLWYVWMLGHRWMGVILVWSSSGVVILVAMMLLTGHSKLHHRLRLIHVIWSAICNCCLLPSLLLTTAWWNFVFASWLLMSCVCDRLKIIVFIVMPILPWMRVPASLLVRQTILWSLVHMHYILLRPHQRTLFQLILVLLQVLILNLGILLLL